MNDSTLKSKNNTPYFIDRYGRRVDSLRISVTYKCNYKCIFCHSEGLLTPISKVDVFTAEDYGFIARVLSRYGVKYYKLTGGEPLLRSDIGDIVAAIKPYAEEVSLVTNGSLLLEKAKILAEAGTDRINVSLHALRRETYEYITGGSGLLDRVIKGIDEALNYGLRVKLNYLLMKSNLEDLPRILEFAEARGLNVSIIELVPLGVPPEVYAREHYPASPIVEYLEKISASKYIREFQNRPVYVLKSGIKVEVVIGYGNRYLCSACTRMRLTPDGCFKTCLYVEKPSVCITEAVKKRNEEELVRLFRDAVLMRKPFFI